VSATEHALVPAARVLVVDDERKNRQLLEVMLGAAGHVVVTAECGADALTLAARERPDLILLDVMMPGMDGYHVAGRLKGEPATRHIPVVLLTALDDRNSKAHGLAAGADAFLTKPVNQAELAAVVGELLTKR
jgi:CheY-like chemotaxis protein